MPQRIVNAFEVVEIEIQQRDALAALSSRERSLELLINMRDLLLSPLTLADVFICTDSTTVRHRLIGNSNSATVGSLAQTLDGFSLPES